MVPLFVFGNEHTPWAPTGYGDDGMIPVPVIQTPQVVALFNSSDDTVEMVRRMLDTSGFSCLVGCHFADLKKGTVDLSRYLERHKPEVVIIDISPPYAENWEYFKTVRDIVEKKGIGLVLTTTNRDRLDETVGEDSKALEIVGKPYDLGQIKDAIHAAFRTAARPSASSRTQELHHEAVKK